MYAANLHQVFSKNPQDQPYHCWVLFVRHGADTAAEIGIRSKHEDIDTILAEQNVNYTEITTHSGKRLLYEKFNSREAQHPLFLVLNKPPLDYRKGDSLMVVEWGKWTDVDEMKQGVMALVNFFSDADFRRDLAGAKDIGMWKRLGTFLGKHGVSILKVGVTVVSALA